MVLTRLAKPFSWVFVGHAGFLASQWLMLVLLAKWGRPEFVGSFALALAISSPIILATGLNFRYVIAASNHRHFAFRDFLGLRTVALLVAVGIIIALGGFGPIGRTTGLTLVFVGIGRAFWALSDVYYGLFLQRDQTKAIAASLLLRSVLGVAGLAIGLALTDDVVWAAAGMAGGWLVPVAVIDLPAALRSDPPGEHPSIHPRWDPRQMARLFRATLPLGALAVLVALIMHTPKYIIGYQLGADDLGYFAAMASLLVPGLTIINSLTQTAVPHLAAHLRDNDTRQFGRTVAALGGVAVGIGFVGLAIAWFIGDWVLATAYAPEYAGRTDVLMWLVAGALFLFLGWVLDGALTSMGRFGVQPAVASGALAVAAGLGWTMTSHSGLVGAATAWTAALALAAIVKCALVAWFVRGVEARPATEFDPVAGIHPGPRPDAAPSTMIHR